MKKLLMIAALLFGTTPLFASLVMPSLGPWNEGDAGATHQLWDFTAGYVTTIVGDGYTAIPEKVANPDPSQVIASISPGGTWDGKSQFISKSYIAVNLEIPNYDILNPYKEIWVDVGTNVKIDLVNVSIAATPTEVDFVYKVLPGQGDADFGFMIWPNPYVEKIGFVLLADAGEAVILDYVHVDTLCVPEPATLSLLALGGVLLRRRRHGRIID